MLHDFAWLPWMTQYAYGNHAAVGLMCPSPMGLDPWFPVDLVAPQTHEHIDPSQNGSLGMGLLGWGGLGDLLMIVLLNPLLLLLILLILLLLLHLPAADAAVADAAPLGPQGTSRISSRGRS